MILLIAPPHFVNYLSAKYLGAIVGFLLAGLVFAPDFQWPAPPAVGTSFQSLELAAVYLSYLRVVAVLLDLLLGTAHYLHLKTLVFLELQVRIGRLVLILAVIVKLLYPVEVDRLLLNVIHAIA